MSNFRLYVNFSYIGFLKNWNIIVLQCGVCESVMKVKKKVAQLCVTLYDPMDYTVHGILQARILEWEPVPSPGDRPIIGIEPGSPALQDSLSAEPQ